MPIMPTVMTKLWSWKLLWKRSWILREFLTAVFMHRHMHFRGKKSCESHDQIHDSFHDQLSRPNSRQFSRQFSRQNSLLLRFHPLSYDFIPSHAIRCLTGAPFSTWTTICKIVDRDCRIARQEVTMTIFQFRWQSCICGSSLTWMEAL